MGVGRPSPRSVDGQTESLDIEPRNLFSSGAFAWDVRLSGVHPPLGSLAERERGDRASDGCESIQPGVREDRRVVPEEPAPSNPGAARDPEPEIARSRRLVRGDREQSIPEQPAIGGGTHRAKMAEPAFVGRGPVVGTLRASAGVLRLAPAASSPLGVLSGSETVTRGAGRVSDARPDLWEARRATAAPTRPTPPDR